MGAPARLRLLVVSVVVLLGLLAAATAGEETIDTVVARRDLPVGARVDGSDLDVRPLPRSMVPPDAAGTVDTVHGRVLRHPLAAGQPVLGRALVDGVDAALAPGRAAVVLPTDLLPGLLAGQRVDVVGDAGSRRAEVLARDALVLLVDDHGVWLEVDRDATAAIGHAVAWGSVTVAVLPPA